MDPKIIEHQAVKRGIDAPSVLRIVNLAWSSTHCELEGRPVQYGMVVGPLEAIMSAVPEGTFRRQKLDLSGCVARDLLDRFGPLYSWATAAILVDRESSMIEGILDPSILKVEDPYEYISGITNSLCVVEKQAFSVRIYYDGDLRVQYIINRKRGTTEERVLSEVVTELARFEVPFEIASKLTKLCIRMSELRTGASIVLGPLSPSCKLLEGSRTVVSSFVPKRAVELPLSQLELYAAKDGAAWIDENWLLRGPGLMFDGPGGRHEIAKHISSSSATTIVLVVSQDGEITLFHEGEPKQLYSQSDSDLLFTEARSA